MLVKLLPEQIAKYWEYVKYAALNSLPPGTDYTQEMVENALENLLSDILQCWWVVTEEDGGADFKLHAILITGFFYDNVTKENTLRVCHAFGFLDMSKELWEDAINTLIEFAKAKDCTSLDAFTENEAILRVGKMYGARIMNYVYYKIGGE